MHSRFLDTAAANGVKNRRIQMFTILVSQIMVTYFYILTNIAFWKLKVHMLHYTKKRNIVYDDFRVGPVPCQLLDEYKN